MIMKVFKVYKELLNEIRVLPPETFKLEKENPLKLSDTIRVYHGFNNYEDGITAILAGISGKELAKRVYSYESDNNPKGVFVTLDFNIAKRFTHPRGENGTTIILELSVKYSDLEAPVWPSGGYTIPGEISKKWNDNYTRDDAILKSKQVALSSDYQFVVNSENPEVAMSLLSAEKQALFVGDINPNMIKTIWVGESGKRGFSAPQMNKLTRKDFINKFNLNSFESGIGNQMSNSEQDYRIKMDRSSKPNDDFSIDLVRKIISDWGFNQTPEEFMNKAIRKNTLNHFFWPKQIDQINNIYNKTKL